MTAALDDRSRRFLDLAATGRAGPAIQYALTLTGAAPSTEWFITDVLGPVQAHVGALWQANRCGEADEHAVTAVVEEVVGALSTRADGAGPSRGRVLVACVEGEQHALPARLGAERLRLQGWTATFWAAVCPVERSSTSPRGRGPTPSCSAARGRSTSRRLGGASPHSPSSGCPSSPQARASVALAGAPTGSAHRVGSARRATRPPCSNGRLAPARARTGSDAAAELEWHVDDLAVGSLSELYARTPALSSCDIACIARHTDDLRDVLRYVWASLEADDRSVLSDYLSWLADTLRSHEAQPDVLDAALEVTAAVAARVDFGEVTAALRRGRLRGVSSP
jgi:hypothetical protein